MMSTINGEVQGAKLTGFQNDHISPDFADTADGDNKPTGAVTKTSRVMKHHWEAYRRECFFKKMFALNFEIKNTPQELTATQILTTQNNDKINK